MRVYTNILAVIAGCFAAVVTIGLGEMMLSKLYPLPQGVNFNDNEAARQAILGMPASSFILMLAAYALASFFGGLIASLISKNQKKRVAIAVGVTLTVFGAYNVWLIPHPIWFTIINLLLFLPSALGGYRVVAKVTGSTRA